MKLYLFNPTKVYNTGIACGIVANDQEEALKLYDYKGDPADYTIEERDIVLGLCIIPDGYDHVTIEAELIPV
jgi:hypothetical protein